MSANSTRIFAWAALAAAGFVADLTPRTHAQEQLWIRQFGTSSWDEPSALAPDGAGGVMVAGWTGGSLGGPHVGGWDAFLARYDRAGNRLWIRQFGTSTYDDATALAPDGKAGVLVAGRTWGSLGGPNAGWSDVYLARYDSAGDRLWIRQFGTAFEERAFALAPNGAGGVTIAGDTTGNLGGPNAGLTDAFLARYDSAGDQLWIRQFGTSSDDLVSALAPDGAGGVMVAGYTTGSLGRPNAGANDVFLARYDSVGDQLWLRQFGTSSDDFAMALAPAGAGGVMVTGTTSGSLGGPNAGRTDAFLARYDSAGNRLWIRQFGSSGRDVAWALAPDGASDVMVAGFTEGSLGGANAGAHDTFLAHYDSTGDRLWIRQFGTNVYDSARALAPDGARGVMLAGQTRGSLGGPSAGSYDAFLTRFTGAFPLGDLNCDAAFNGADIDPFFLALGDPAAYAIAFPYCGIMLGDMNRDGRLDGGDIDPFFQCLGGGSCP